ncbi:MAG: hypothetical protein WA829_11990 [Candidatus Acidiferrum sp.]
MLSKTSAGSVGMPVTAWCAILAWMLVSVPLIMPATHSAQQSGDSEKKLKNRNLSWSPPALDSPVRSLVSSPPCELSKVLEQAAERESEQVINLQNFTAQERVQYQTFDRIGSMVDLGSETFDYIVVFEPSSGGLLFQEKRNPTHGSSLSAAASQDMGLPEMVLIFLPNMQADYEMTCEGAAKWDGQLSWVIQFQQRKDRPSRTYSFRVDNVVYPVGLKGRAWISSDTGEVVHLETALMEAVPVVRLQHSYLSIDYAPVQFKTQPVKIWLPQLVDGFWDFGDHRTIVYHTFTNFLLFSVQTDQTIAKPKQP